MAAFLMAAGAYVRMSAAADRYAAPTAAALVAPLAAVSSRNAPQKSVAPPAETAEEVGETVEDVGGDVDDVEVATVFEPEEHPAATAADANRGGSLRLGVRPRPPARFFHIIIITALPRF